MNVGQLIELLKDYDSEAEVRLAIQPSWPFEHRIAGVVGTNDIDVDDDDEAYETEREIPQNVVWIAEGGQVDYLNSRVFEAV